jgi:hypothetical protein
MTAQDLGQDLGQQELKQQDLKQPDLKQPDLKQPDWAWPNSVPMQPARVPVRARV